MPQVFNSMKHLPSIASTKTMASTTAKISPEISPKINGVLVHLL